jgi:hypothetical protein
MKKEEGFCCNPAETTAVQIQTGLLFQLATYKPDGDFTGLYQPEYTRMYLQNNVILHIVSRTALYVTTVLRGLTMWIRSEKCVVRRFRRCANVIVYLKQTYILQPTTHLGYMV